MMAIKPAKRPRKAGTNGRSITLFTNSYHMTQFPTTTLILRYFVTIEIPPGTWPRYHSPTSKRRSHIWCSQELKQYFGRDWESVVYDGYHLAWSPRPLPFGDELQLTLAVRPPNNQSSGGEAEGAKETTQPSIAVRICIHKIGQLTLAPVEAWISGQSEADTNVNQGVTFLHHLISQRLRLDSNYLRIKRVFFRVGLGVADTAMGDVMVVKKGLQLSVKGGGNKLFVNANLEASMFWAPGSLLKVMHKLLGNSHTTLPTFAESLVNRWSSSQIQLRLKRFRGLKIYSIASGPNRRRWSIFGFSNANALETRFVRRSHSADGSVTETTVSVAEYFRDTYNITLQFPNLRLVQVSLPSQTYLPIELCHIAEDNPYHSARHWDNRQRVATMRPSERRRTVDALVPGLRWNNNATLASYGIQIHNAMHRTNARILPAPKLQYGNRMVRAATGQWNLRGKKLYKPRCMRSFGLLLFTSESELPRHEATIFLQTLCSAYIAHGGRVENLAQAPIEYVTAGTTPRDAVHSFYQRIQDTFSMRPDIIFCAYPLKGWGPYDEIKLTCDEELRCASQCTVMRSMRPQNQQYLSNLCMKINAKLGGSSCTLERHNHPLYHKGATLVIGANTSQGSPGSLHGQSVATMVGSLDLQATRYSAAYTGNGNGRSKVITDENMGILVKTMLKNFRRNTKVIPQRIFYFRAGVTSQNQNATIDISTEVAKIKEICRAIPIPGEQGVYSPYLTVTICSNEQHWRFFAANSRDGDRNGNALPGTIIDTDICIPSKYDFYLTSHKAIQGTARPAHYHVIYDENQFSVDEFQALCYNMCYTDNRSTRSLSIIPVIHYARLAAKRANARLSLSDTPQRQQQHQHQACKPITI